MSWTLFSQICLLVAWTAIWTAYVKLARGKDGNK